MKPKLKDVEREEIFSPSWTRFQRRRRRGGLRRRGCGGLRCRGVEGWWLARGEAKGSAARVAAEKIKAKIGYNNDDPPILQPVGGEGTSAVAKAATDTQTVVESPAKKGEEEKDGSALKHLKAQLPLQLFATVLT